MFEGTFRSSISCSGFSGTIFNLKHRKIKKFRILFKVAGEGVDSVILTFRRRRGRNVQGRTRRAAARHVLWGCLGVGMVLT